MNFHHKTAVAGFVITTMAAATCVTSTILGETPLAPHPAFLKRRTVYAFTNERVSDEQLRCVFEAARWAPSAWNQQPTHYIYAHRGTKSWDILLHLIGNGNRWWAQDAPVLAVVLRKKRSRSGKQFDRTEFEIGCSWMSLAIQATMLGLATHVSGEIEFEEARQILQVPDNFDIVLMFGLGKQATTGIRQDTISRDRRRSTQRKEISEFVTEGHTFTF
ncbi:MAG: hypothetical protein QG632_270 [Candidatus Dependentiae bacterium]|nr:hypothetical protein [Candidatus Dependentiae bacterium]